MEEAKGRVKTAEEKRALGRKDIKERAKGLETRLKEAEETHKAERTKTKALDELKEVTKMKQQDRKREIVNSLNDLIATAYEYRSSDYPQFNLGEALAQPESWLHEPSPKKNEELIALQRTSPNLSSKQLLDSSNKAVDLIVKGFERGGMQLPQELTKEIDHHFRLMRELRRAI